MFHNLKIPTRTLRSISLYLVSFIAYTNVTTRIILTNC